MSFLVSALQHLFKRDIQKRLKFDPGWAKVQKKTDFDADVVTFTETGLLTDDLLQFIWQPLKLNAEKREVLKHLLIHLDLCYIDDSTEDDKANSSLRFPWFLSKYDEEGLVQRAWPETIPPLHVQFSLIYHFVHRVPPAIYERFCVRIQKHLIPHGHKRYDYTNTVYIAQDDVQVMILKNPQPSVQIHLRCSTEHLSKLQPLMLALYLDIEKLHLELPGWVLDRYLLCPHCLLKRVKFPKRRPTKVMTLRDSIEVVSCGDNERIPAALVYPSLLGNFFIHINILFCYDSKKSANEKLLKRLEKNSALKLKSFSVTQFLSKNTS